MSGVLYSKGFMKFFGILIYAGIVVGIVMMVLAALKILNII